MKKLAAVLFILFASCVTSKPINNLINNEKLKGKEPGTNEFVIKNNGEQINGSIKAYPNPNASSKKQFYGIDDIKIPSLDVKAYQNQFQYVVIYREVKNKDGLALDRLRSGKISLFMDETGYNIMHGNAHEFDYEYYFNKGQEQIEHMEYDAFENAVSDNSAALDLLHSLFPKKKIPFDRNGQVYDEGGTRGKLSKIVDLYNN